MSVLVNTKNEQEEKILLAFLNSLNYKYEYDVENTADAISSKFLDQYNAEIDSADREVEAGNFISHEEVEQLFKNRRKLD